MSSRLSDPQRLVELVADQMFRDEMRSGNGRRRAGEDAATSNGRPADVEASGERPSPCDPPD
jgi:hypothetical protein